MLSGYWLFSDLDGTLISTPHKANGAYLPINQSPCYEPLQRWLLNGGNLCVITTADQRVVDQVYHPLRECLGIGAERVRNYRQKHFPAEQAAAKNANATNTTTTTSTSASPSGNVGPSSQGNVAKGQSAELPFTGDNAKAGCTLLLSLYTGAVLYRCTKNQIQMVTDYFQSMHCATEESGKLFSQYNIPMWTAPVYSYSFGSAAFEYDSDYFSRNAKKNLPMDLVNDGRVCVKGTCISRATSTKLKNLVNGIYINFVKYILEGQSKVLSALSKMSRRYKRMWKGLLAFLDIAHSCATGEIQTNTSSSAAKAQSIPALELFRRVVSKNNSSSEEEESDIQLLFRRGSESADEVQWKLNFLTHRPDLLIVLGILRMEFVEMTVEFGDLRKSGAAGGSSEEKKKFELAVSLAEKVLLGNGDAQLSSIPLYKEVTQQLAQFMCKLLGTDGYHVEKSLDKANCDSPVENVAQVIVLGAPLALFSLLFKQHIPALIRHSVSALPQPNSVVFSKLGVSKSTAIRYLLGKDLAAAELAYMPGAPTPSPPSRAPEQMPFSSSVSNTASWSSSKSASISTSTTASTSGAEPMRVCGCVEVGYAVALGDNPHTTDYELTVFEDVPFFSVEKDSQRNQRHQRIARRMTQADGNEKRGLTRMDGQGKVMPTVAELTAMLRSSGPMMDDRLLPHLVFVGGEESGSATFLAVLMNQLRVPQLYYSRYPRRQLNDPPVMPEEFQQAISAAATVSRSMVQGGPLSKL